MFLEELAQGLYVGGLSFRGHLWGQAHPRKTQIRLFRCCDHSRLALPFYSPLGTGGQGGTNTHIWLSIVLGEGLL